MPLVPLLRYLHWSIYPWIVCVLVAFYAIWGASLGIAVGALLIALRLFAVPPPDPDALRRTLPEGRGPWAATVESISPVRDGQQVATLRLAASSTPPATGTLLAATLPRYPPVEPGDQLRLVVDVLRAKPPYWKMRGEAFVEKSLVCEAELMAMIADDASSAEAEE